MIDAVTVRLENLGHEVTERDLDALEQAMELAREELCRATNCEEVPDGLVGVWIERACVHFLRGLGMTDVKMGDVSLEFENRIPGAARYRKMVW